ncbi:MAG TPA: hypothetical protein VGF67_25810 [Ktedonobacteraceae bacterium]|jgi:hypothetical protein
MDIHTLDQDLQIVGGQLTLTASTLPGLSLQPWLLVYNQDQPLIIASARKEVRGHEVIVSGTTPFMGVPSLAVTATFHLDTTNTPVAQLRFTLIGKKPAPNAWRFSTSFPQIPLAMDYAQSVTIPHLNVYDELQLTDAAFVLSTGAGNDQTTGVPLVPGLNFIATLNPQGLTGLFDSLLGGKKQVTLYGPIVVPTTGQVTPELPPETYPWQTSWPVPGILLQADLGIAVTLAKLKFQNCALRLYTPLTSDWLDANATYEPIIAITGTLQIPGANVSVDALVELTRNYAYTPIAGIFQGVSLASLASLADLANGNDLLDLLPAAIKGPLLKAGGLSLEQAALILTDRLSAEAVASVFLSVGMPQVQWTVFSGVTVEHLFAAFLIDSPFITQQRTVSAQIGGTIDIGGVLLDVITQVPDFTVRAELQDEAVFPLKAFFQQYVPELPAPPDLQVGEAQLVITPGSSYDFTASMLDDPAWTLDLGPLPLTLSNVELSLSRQTSRPAQGTFTATLALGQDLELTTSYTLPGDFLLRADLPEVHLSSVIALLNEIDLPLPTGFDIDLKQASVLIERVASDLSFNVAADISTLGLLAFTVQRQSAWGFALGVDLTLSSLSALPGLAVLAPFERFVGLETLMLVVSSFDGSAGFQFPDMANFQVPSLGNGKIQLPRQASGLVRGLNIYARLRTTQSTGFRVLATYLGLQLDGTVGITLAVSLPDPLTNSKLFVSVSGEIQPGTTLVGELGGLLQGGEIGVFLTAVVKTQVQNQPMEFDVTAMVLENGVLICGTMQGTIHFGPVQLSNLALVVGLDFEGIPSLGIAATLDINTFESALALFFDSTDPAKSLVAGALSSLTLLDIARYLAGQQDIPAGLDTVLGLIGLKELKAFSMPAALALSLDNRDIPAISAAFMQYGSIHLAGSSDLVLLVINERGALWHLTDLATMQHYSLKLRGTDVAVTLEPQLYIAPATTFIGSLQYPQGCDITAEIDYLLIQAQIKILISAQQGIAADVDLAPIVLLSRDFFSLTGAGGQGGPHLSLATYRQPELTDPQLRDPHFLITGNLRLLGADTAGLSLLISEQGLTFALSSQTSPLLFLQLHGSIDGLSQLDIGGSIVVGINRSLDLGVLGSLSVDVTVNGALDITYIGGSAAASVQGGFVFQGIQCNIAAFGLDVHSPALQNIGETLWNQIVDIISKLLKNPDQWLEWVRTTIISGVGQAAEQVGQILVSVYQLSADAIASKTSQILGYSIDGVSQALKGAGCSANEAVSALKDVGYQTADIATAVGSVFTSLHADINVGHIDTPAGPHLDTPTSHLDVPGTHVDSTTHADLPGSHIDSSVHADTPHVDSPVGTIVPHGDAHPHTDQSITPHGDSNPHIDQTTTPHGDTSTPHGDSQIPPHGDTSSHVDVNS